ncbi:MAG: hypothetical protein MUD12_10365 [Spirochaetes bacterium]|jgi:hypothetical protein|nr:hypothetical protein [Spirochaetota bacterium]
MKIIHKILIVSGAVAALIIGIVFINIMQKGGAYTNKPMSEILGCSSEKADVKQILALSKSDFFQLFYSAPAPDAGDFSGEFSAMNHPGGIMAPAVQVFTDNFFGKGKWTGKKFSPLKNNEGEGFNIFIIKQNSAGAPNKRILERKMKTHIGKSVFDNKDSYHVVYKSFNSDIIVSSMRDEIRKINGNLYIGFGYMDLGGGSINPSGFILYKK